MPNWSLGRTGQLYVIAESAYDTSTTLAATNALRHLNLQMHYSPKSLAKSPERKTHPSQITMYTRRAQASWAIKGMLYPSGTLNTLPEVDVILRNAFGAAPRNVTLSATVLTAASTPAEAAPTTTVFAITDIGTLAVNDPVQIVIASGAGAGTHIRWITTIAAAAGAAPKKLITVTPALPAAPALADTVKGCVGWTPATAIGTSLDLCHYPQSPSTWYNREILGAVTNKLSLTFDSNTEPMFEASGPAAEQVSAQTQPSAFTTVGAESAIPSGLTGSFRWGGTVYQIEQLVCDIDNAMELQNTALGTAKAVAAFRKGKRDVTLRITAKVSDDLTMWTPSLTPSSGTLFLQVGTTAARMWGLYCPVAQIKNPPDAPDNDETVNWSFEIAALGTSGNDEVFFAQA